MTRSPDASRAPSPSATGSFAIEIRDLDGTRPPQRRAGDRRHRCRSVGRHACGRRRRTDGRAPGVGSRTRRGRGAAERHRGWCRSSCPINDGEGDAIAVVALWRDAADLMARLDATRRDIMLVTLAAAVILAGILFLVFRAAQARLTRQHRQLIDATRSDALTGMLNHGAVVALLAEEIETRAVVERADRRRARGRRQLPALQRHAWARRRRPGPAEGRRPGRRRGRRRPRRPLRAGRVPDRPAGRRDRRDRRPPSSGCAAGLEAESRPVRRFRAAADERQRRDLAPTRSTPHR